jgi:RimJ/RimL family protein N-acetyltransferase
VRDYQFHVRQKDRVISWMSPDNLASRHVAEKIGMRFEKWSTNRLGGPMVVYSIRRSHAVLAEAQRKGG